MCEREREGGGERERGGGRREGGREGGRKGGREGEGGRGRSRARALETRATGILLVFCREGTLRPEAQVTGLCGLSWGLQFVANFREQFTMKWGQNEHCFARDVGSATLSQAVWVLGAGYSPDTAGLHNQLPSKLPRHLQPCRVGCGWWWGGRGRATSMTCDGISFRVRGSTRRPGTAIVVMFHIFYHALSTSARLPNVALMVAPLTKCTTFRCGTGKP